MIYGFYFRFLKLIHNKWICICLAKMANVLKLCYFLLKRLGIKKSVAMMSKEDALDILNTTHADSCGRPEYKEMVVDSNMDLSIIVPIYNYKELIKANIESALEQKTKYNFELILVDDGSTDGAREIVLQYQGHPQVKVILQDNQGIAGARNTGINAAQGRYLMFIDCDDVVHDDLVETLLDRAYQDDCDIVMCAHNLVKEKNGQVVDVIPNIYPQKNLLNYKNGDEIMNYAGLPWGKVYKQELFKNVRFFPGYWYEDTIIQWLLFTQCSKFAYVPKVCYEYKWYEKNFSHVQGNKCSAKAIDQYWILLAIIEQYKELQLPIDEQFYTLLLTHLSTYYYPLISGLENQVVEAAFVMACELLQQYRPEKQCKLSYILKVTEKALLTRDINLWKLASVNQ